MRKKKLKLGKSLNHQLNLDDIKDPNNAWLELPEEFDLTKISTNKLKNINQWDREHLDVAYGRMLTDPDYFIKTAQRILNLEMMPIHAAVFQELWKRPFPMLVCSRGFSKCQKDSFIVTDRGYFRMPDLFNIEDKFETHLNCDFAVLGESGFRKPDYKYKKIEQNTIKITTDYRFNLEGSPDHPIRIVRDGKIIWEELRNLKLDDKIIIDRNAQKYWPSNVNDIAEDVGYLFGVLVGDGGYTVRGRIGITSNDPEIVDNANKGAVKIWGTIFKKKKAKYQYYLYGVKLWDELFQKYGFNSTVCGEKDIPTSILQSSKQTVKAFLQGLFDTDGCCHKDKLGVEYCTKSKKLAQSVQFLLTRFGIISKIYFDHNKKYNTTYYKICLFGQNAKVFYNEIGFKLARKQKTLESHSNIICNTNKDVLPHSLVLDKILYLQSIFFETQSLGRKRHYESSLITPWRLKKYELSYEKFKTVLDILSESDNCKDHPFYQELLDILNQYYFFDTIKKIESGRSELYEFYIPEDHSYISGGLISHNSFMLAIVALLKCIFIPKTKIVIVGAAFRQSKVVFEYMETIWRDAPILRDICRSNDGPAKDVDRWTFTLNDSFTVAIPLGTGDKIRGLRANIIMAEEFGSISPDIYETVVVGFGAVSQNPVVKAKQAAKRKKLQERGIWTDQHELLYNARSTNQTIISGTAGYDFEHFAAYWKKYKSYIESRGDKEKLMQAFGGEIPDAFNWKDFSIIRIPYELCPQDFMDDKMVSRAQATMHTAIYNMEYGACFVKDSMGFFKRSLIEKCTVSDENRIHNELFDPVLRGDPKKQYIIAIDPAIETDNLAIVILELAAGYRKVVYCWTTNKKDFVKRRKLGQEIEHDFYGFVARKIRNLMKVFPTIRIGMDAQGGGRAVEEALHDPKKLEPDENPATDLIYQIIEDDEEKPTDDLPGKHILELIEFADAKWTAEANNGLKRDMEDRTILFPRYDGLSLGLAYELGEIGEKKDQYEDSLDDCTFEIQEMKDELTTIVMSRTGTGQGARDRWDTPEFKDTITKKKGRLRKDRYSALLIGNMLARQMMLGLAPVTFNSMGGNARQFAKKVNDNDVLYTGPRGIPIKIYGGAVGRVVRGV